VLQQQQQQQQQPVQQHVEQRDEHHRQHQQEWHPHPKLQQPPQPQPRQPSQQRSQTELLVQAVERQHLQEYLIQQQQPDPCDGRPVPPPRPPGPPPGRVLAQSSCTSDFSANGPIADQTSPLALGSAVASAEASASSAIVASVVAGPLAAPSDIPLKARPQFADWSNLSNDPWTAMWAEACRENSRWLIFGYGTECYEFPWCGLCGHWADETHLMSRGCCDRRQAFSISVGPVLSALLEVAFPVPAVSRSPASMPQPAPQQFDGPPPPPPMPTLHFADSPPSVGAALLPKPPPPLGPPPGWTPPSAHDVVTPVPPYIGGRAQCANAGCGFLAHELPEFAGFCCKKCHEFEFSVCRSQHGKRCRREAVPASFHAASGAPSPAGFLLQTPEQWQTLAHSADAATAPPSRLPSHLNLVACLAVAVTQGVDVYTTEMRRLLPHAGCTLRGEALLVSDTDPLDGPHRVLRGPVHPAQGGGYVTLAVLQEGHIVTSKFFEPLAGWDELFSRALDMDELWAIADKAWERAEAKRHEFGAAQQELRELVEGPYECGDLSERVSWRRDRWDEAIAALHDCRSSHAEASRKTFGWRGGAQREVNLEILLRNLEELEKGRSLNVKKELDYLSECRSAMVKAKNSRRSAETNFQNAQEEHIINPMDGEELDRLQEEKRRTREDARTTERAFFRAMSKLCKHAIQHAPEMLPEIRKTTQDTFRAELKKLRPSEQCEVLQVFATEWSLSQYDKDMCDGNRLSGKDARHGVYLMAYEGKECVLKAFDLRTHRGLPGFLQEVVLHVRLRHPLVVPLRYAFLDWGEHRGFLHFDKYASDLAAHIAHLRVGKTPHRLGEPVEAGAIDRMKAVKRIVHAMIQSVAHIHAHGVVHGDLKPSNWLWNAQSNLPCLCDFETAKDRGIAGASTPRGRSTTGPNLFTHDYAAPELLENLTSPRAKESDVFALGRSIQQVMRCVEQSRSPEKQKLEELVSDMTLNDPGQRITAAKAAEAWWDSSLSISDGETKLVRCDEIRFTQAACSSTFTDGRPLEELVHELLRDPEFALRDERLILDVVKKGHALMSLDNRRLWCFHEAQRKYPQQPLWIRIKLHEYTHVWERFKSNLSTRNGGVSIHVRRGGRTGPSSGYEDPPRR